MAKTEAEEKLDIEKQDEAAKKIQAFSAGKLKAFVKRIVRILDDQDALTADLKEILIEADGLGFDKKRLKQVAKESREEKETRDHGWEILNLYRSALGLLDGTPLGDYAAKQEAEQEPGVETAVVNGKVTTIKSKRQKKDEAAIEAGATT